MIQLPLLAALTSQMYDLYFIILFRRLLKIITKKAGALVATATHRNAFFITTQR